MTEGAAIWQYVFPPMVVAVATVLLCFCFHLKKKRGGYDVTIPAEVHTISLSESQAEVDTHYDRFSPLSNTMDPPPPYSLFDPKLTDARTDEPPPAYDMYPIMLPLTPHHWERESEPPQPTSPPPPINHPNRQRSRRTSSSWT